MGIITSVPSTGQGKWKQEWYKDRSETKFTDSDLIRFVDTDENPDQTYSVSINGVSSIRATTVNIPIPEDTP